MKQKDKETLQTLLQRYKELGIAAQQDYERRELDAIVANSVALTDTEYGTVIAASEEGKWSRTPSIAEQMAYKLTEMVDKS